MIVDVLRRLLVLLFVLFVLFVLLSPIILKTLRSLWRVILMQAFFLFFFKHHRIRQTGLFAVFHSLLALVGDEGTSRATNASTADLGSQVSSLIRLNLLTKIGSKKKKSSSLDMMRLKCNVQKNIVETISNELDFNIKKYLFDYDGC